MTATATVKPMDFHQIVYAIRHALKLDDMYNLQKQIESLPKENHQVAFAHIRNRIKFLTNKHNQPLKMQRA